MNTIRTKRLVLTTVTIADTVFLKQLFSFADVKKYYVLREDHMSNIDLFTAYMVDSIKNGQSIEYIVRLTNGTPIGLVGGELYREQTGEISWNTAYAILPSYQRNGYATEALVSFTEYIKQYNIVKAFLDISDNNEASKKVAQNAGYKYNKDTAHFDPKHMELSVLFHWELMLHSNRDVFLAWVVRLIRQKTIRLLRNISCKHSNKSIITVVRIQMLCVILIWGWHVLRMAIIKKLLNA